MTEEKRKTGSSAKSVISVTWSPWEWGVWVVRWLPRGCPAKEFVCTAVFTKKLLAQLTTGGEKRKEDSELACIYSGCILLEHNNPFWLRISRYLSTCTKTSMHPQRDALFHLSSCLLHLYLTLPGALQWDHGLFLVTMSMLLLVFIAHLTRKTVPSIFSKGVSDERKTQSHIPNM